MKISSNASVSLEQLQRILASARNISLALHKLLLLFNSTLCYEYKYSKAVMCCVEQQERLMPSQRNIEELKFSNSSGDIKKIHTHTCEQNTYPCILELTITTETTIDDSAPLIIWPSRKRKEACLTLKYKPQSTNPYDHKISGTM